MSDDLNHTCHACGGHITYPAHAVGQTVACPHCEQATTLGESPATSRAAPDVTGHGQPSKRGLKVGLLIGVGVLVLAGVAAGIWMVATRKAKDDGKTAQQSAESSASGKPTPTAPTPAVSSLAASASAKIAPAKDTGGIPRVSTPGSPWPGQYKLRPENKLTAADVVGPDGVVYPDWRYAGVRGGIPDVPVAAKIEDFGGKADDNLDDSEALDKAAEAVGKKGGGAILLGPGTYYLDRPVVITQNGVVIRGSGKDKTKLLFRYLPPANGVTIFRPRPDDVVNSGTWFEIHGRPQGLTSLRLEVDGQLMAQKTDFPPADGWGPVGDFSLSRMGWDFWNKLQPKDGPHEIKAIATYRNGQRGEAKMTSVFGASDGELARAPTYKGIGAITFLGSEWSGPWLKLRKDGRRGDLQLELESTEGLVVGDSILLMVPGSDRWGKLIQCTDRFGNGGFRRYSFLIEKLEGTKITLNQPLRLDYPVADGAQLHRTVPIRRCGVEDLEIRQLNQLKTSGVIITAGQDCWVRRVSIKKAGHFLAYATESKWCEIRDCDFDDVWYQRPASGYVGWESCSDCLMDTVVTRNLRYGPWLTWGSSGNVFRRCQFIGTEGQWHGGWPNENLIEQCEISSQPNSPHGKQGIASTSPDFGPGGPRNVVYNCSFNTPKPGLWMGGMNESYLILYNKFEVGSGPGVFAKTSSFDHIIKGNVFRLADATKPAIWVDDATCVGIEFTDNLVVGGNGQISGGAGKLEVDHGNTIKPLANVQAPQPAVPSIFEWQRNQKK